MDTTIQVDTYNGNGFKIVYPLEFQIDDFIENNVVFSREDKSAITVSYDLFELNHLKDALKQGSIEEHKEEIIRLLFGEYIEPTLVQSNIEIAGIKMCKISLKNQNIPELAVFDLYLGVDPNDKVIAFIVFLSNNADPNEEQILMKIANSYTIN